MQLLTDEDIIYSYGNIVYAVAINYVKNRFDADDIYSETFLRYFKKSRTFESEEHRKAYIIRMAVNCAKDFLSDRSRHTANIEEAEPSEPDKTDSLAIRDTLDTLEPDERNIVYLFYYHGMKSSEIAGLYGISDDAVRTRLRRIREKLKDLMSQ